MAKKHKHEEHVNHERWLVSFADMMTLLFALFVVLYAMGVQDLDKLRKLKKSIQFAFNSSGSGQSQDKGIFEKESRDGAKDMEASKVTAQDVGLEAFLEKDLVEFEKKMGDSLDVVITDDSVAMSAPLSDYFEDGITGRLRAPVQPMLDHIIDGSLSFTSTVRFVIQAPDLPVYSGGLGKPAITSSDLCFRRLSTIGRFARLNPRVLPSMVIEEFQEQNERGDRGSWENQARLTIVFSNMVPENR
jgi:hypothetical protein